MTDKRELTEFERGEIIGSWKCGVKIVNIMRELKYSYSTVWDVIERYKQRGTAENAPRSGRPAALDDRDKRRLVRVPKGERTKALQEITDDYNIGVANPVSSRTVQRALHSKGYYGRVAKKKPLVSEPNRKKRLAWCRMRKEWHNEWNMVIFSDESRFEMFNNDSQMWVWRQTGEKYNKDCLRPTVQKSDGIMVWGCFCRGMIGPLVLVEGRITAEKYREILSDHLIPFLNSIGFSEYLFQDDNAPAHTARSTRTWKEDNSINVLPWPAQSPDLNPIENLWDELVRRVRAHKPRPKNKRELFTVIKNEWENIEIVKLNNLIDSMPRRVAAVIKNKGNPTKY